MKIVVLGGDGYLGWPTTLNLSVRNHEVITVDNYSRREIAKKTNSLPIINNLDLSERLKLYKKYQKNNIKAKIFDCRDFNKLSNLFKSFKPDVVIHYAEQPSAPYSMKGYKEANYTLKNNLDVTFNLIWAVIKHCPNCHIVKLGTMGEYGTPNIDIEEGWIDIKHKGRKQKFLYPRQGSSLYHTTKVLDTDLLWFYVRVYGLKVTDLMQGPVYGIYTKETSHDDKLMPNFHYDDIFGTVINRFIIQAIAEVPLTVYGKGNQTRGYLNILDTLQCINLAIKNPPNNGELKILNQFVETFSVNELAKKVQKASKKLGINVQINSIHNPRKELENHYYNPAHSEFKKMGLKPHLLSEEILISMINKILPYKGKINKRIILPRVGWN